MNDEDRARLRAVVEGSSFLDDFFKQGKVVQRRSDLKQLILKAKNPETSESDLDRLSKLYIDDWGYMPVAVAVARNPNAAPLTLRRLRDLFDRHVSRNPALGLIGLEHPEGTDSESELWRRAQGGDREAYQRLVREFGWPNK